MSSTHHSDSQPYTSVSLPSILRWRSELCQRQHQRGMGMLTVFIIMAVAAFLGMFAFKVGPHYMENWTVSKIASDVASDPELQKQPRSKVYSYIHQAYSMNNLWELKPEETIKLKKAGNGGYLVHIQYEKRDTLIRNIDVVTSFDKQVLPTQ